MAASQKIAACWRGRAEKAARCAAAQEVACADAGLSTPVADYRVIAYRGLDGTELRARAILPKAPGPHPCILVWHDLDRGARGWFQLTRYLAAGYAVVHPEYRRWTRDLSAGWQDGPEGLEAARLVEDALVAAHVARALPGVDPERLFTHGEGFGGLFALAAAALVPGVARCAVVNAMPADVRGAWERGAGSLAYEGVYRHFREEDPCAEQADEFFSALAYVDAAELAALVPQSCEVLDGICLMDDVAPAETQRAAYDRMACPKRLVTYPKYAHERLNDFENRLLSFMHFGER